MAVAVDVDVAVAVDVDVVVDVTGAVANKDDNDDGGRGRSIAMSGVHTASGGSERNPSRLSEADATKIFGERSGGGMHWLAETTMLVWRGGLPQTELRVVLSVGLWITLG